MRRRGEEETAAVLVLTTLGAAPRRRLRARKGRAIEQAEPEAVPTARATVVRPEPFTSAEHAKAWLDRLRRDKEGAGEELAGAVLAVGRALHAHRVSVGDPSVPEVSAERALVARLGYGRGPEVAEGRFQEAWELPPEGDRTRRSMQAPEERFAAILGGREQPLAAEELLLRARADLGAGRTREAALQARVALEALLAELEPARGEQLAEGRGPVGDAANAALRGDLDEARLGALTAEVERMEAAVRRHRLRS